ncbi:hypothetical protein Cgig2_007355 [Carnegiea gigantea]|uniref:Uncharacterized protein n=1 Tax=Carnegiea gigantea TaxID=171969 RepID=A0A9Q1QRH5_9CARY|nr:hypothetical protein Cgig2_007355 [Carnegiea gigantea]
MVVGIVVGMFGKGGIVAVGKEGMFGKDGIWAEWAKGWWAVVAGQPEAGNGGILVGSVGTEGPVCNRWRAARVMLILDIDMAMIGKSMNTNLVAAILWSRRDVVGQNVATQQQGLAHLPGDWTLETFPKWVIQETLGKHEDCRKEKRVKKKKAVV